jgi:hypothetical protein
MQFMKRPTPLPRWLAFLSIALILPFVALATPCAKQWDTCYDCDPVEGLCLPTPLASANSQAAQPCACDESGRADRPDETLAPLFDLELSQGMATPNAMVRHTPIHRHIARGPDLALRLYHGYRYEVGNNGFVRHMGK